MADFVERLREMRTLVEAAPIRYGMTSVEMCEKAAAEIEGLRAINDRLMSRLGRITDYADTYSETAGEPEFTYLTTISAWGKEAVKWACQKENELPSWAPLPADATLDIPQGGASDV